MEDLNSAAQALILPDIVVVADHHLPDRDRAVLAGSMLRVPGAKLIPSALDDTQIPHKGRFELPFDSFLAAMDGQDADDQKQSTADMTAFVQNLLLQMQSRFMSMSENIVAKIDEMGNRIDELEQSINDLKTELGAEGTPKAKPEEAKPPGNSN